MITSFERPPRIDIIAKPYKKDSLTFLRHAIIGRVQEARNHTVVQPRALRACMMAFKARQMIFPILVVLNYHLGMFHLQLNILKIVLKRCAHEPFDILKHECLRAGFTQRTDGLWEHIAGVVVGTMATTKAEWLARRTTGYQIERTIETSEAYAPNIALYDFQPRLFRGCFRQSILVLAKSVAAPPVVLNDELRLKTCFGETNAQASSTSEQLDGLAL